LVEDAKDEEKKNQTEITRLEGVLAADPNDSNAASDL